MKNLPSENVIVTGDFNINLLSSSCKSFEEIMFSNNLIPTISLATHEKPGCTPSLIDNILLNSTENLIVLGFCNLEYHTILPDMTSVKLIWTN